MSKPFSPKAQAIMDACGTPSRTPLQLASRGIAAATLRTAAEQVIPKAGTPWNSVLTPVLLANEIREELLSIADELENYQ